MSFERPRQNNSEHERWVADEQKRIGEERKKQDFEYAKREKEIHEAAGWQLVSGQPETVGKFHSAEEIENEYTKKYRKNFQQIELVPTSGSKSSLMAEPGDSYYVYARTKEAAEKSRKRHKEARDKLVGTVQENLKNLGFKKLASTWRREIKGVVQVLNLQTSAYSYRYFFNIGIFIRGRDKDKPIEKINEVDCQYRWRLEELMVKETDEVAYKQAADFNAIPNEYAGEPPETAQIKKIGESIKNYAAPFFDEAQTEQKVKEFVKELEARKAAEE